MNSAASVAMPIGHELGLTTHEVEVIFRDGFYWNFWRRLWDKEWRKEQDETHAKCSL
jgi:hypothetical protein